MDTVVNRLNCPEAPRRCQVFLPDFWRGLGQMQPDELDDVAYLGSWQRDVPAGVRVQGLLRRAQQVVKRETVFPGEQLVVPLEQEQNWRPDGPRGRCERLRSFGQTLLVRPAEIRRPAEEPEHGRLQPGFGRHERDAETSSHGQPDVSDKVRVDVAPLAREVDCRA